MAIEILMPAPVHNDGRRHFGQMTSKGRHCRVWRHHEIETDKDHDGFEAVDEGIIGKILIAEGTEGVKVAISYLVVEEGEDVPAAVVMHLLLLYLLQRHLPSSRTLPFQPHLQHQADVTLDWPLTLKPNRPQCVKRCVTRDSDTPRRNVFLMGEEVANTKSAYKINKGMLDGGVSALSTPILRTWFCWYRGAALVACVRLSRFMVSSPKPDH
jgi:hypothetical protein